MMNSGQKKKTRVRNRPRNKCNQLDEKESKYLQRDQESKPKFPQNTAAEAVESQEAIKLIQQLLRKKLLSKNAQQSQVAQSLTKAAGQDYSCEAVSIQLLRCFGDKLQKGAASSSTSALASNLGKLFNQAPVSDLESSDDEAEYVEYIYKPRQYFMASLCNLCKLDLCGGLAVPCKRCNLSYYCKAAHMKDDQSHRQMCYALRQLAEQNGHDIFYKCGDFSADQFRSYRIVCVRQLEQIMNRNLTATEQEVLLFPRICREPKCREYRLKRLDVCNICGEVAFCKDKPSHLGPSHSSWCAAYRLFKSLVVFQAKYGRLEPSLPTKVLKELPMNCYNTRQIMRKLSFDVADDCEYAALTQVATGPLTAWYALKLCDRLHGCEQLTINLIGAEIEFEVDVLQKWELFLLHITPSLKVLNIVFIGPELNPNNISFQQLQKIKCCRICRKSKRSVNYHFENMLFHDYCAGKTFLNPDLVCFFNAGLYRSTGFRLEDTWPETIHAALNIRCPIVVTSYTRYEAPLDMARFLNESNRHVNVVLPPTINSFASQKPERNFISEEEAPFMFKNFNCFVLE